MTVEAATPARTSYDEWRDGRWRLTGAVIGLMALVTAALLVTIGVRPATYGDLLSDVASSEVDEVRVIGATPVAAGDTVELRWTVWAGVLDQYAVVQVEPGGRGYDAWQEPVFVTSEDPRETLRGINRSILVTSGPSVRDSSFSVMEWRAPGAVALLAMATWLAVLLLLVGGPEPWRATRWAWAWFVLLAGPLGSVAYLLLGGPLGLGRPRNPDRRLTGGWAFLLSVLVFGGGDTS